MAAHVHTVLVVDDDAETREALTYYLRTIGYEARRASGGEDALRQLREGFTPCNVVVDVAMPGMDGWQLLDAVRADPAFAALPVVMLTGTPEHASEAARRGVQSYFTKPADPGGIAAMIAQHCCYR